MVILGAGLIPNDISLSQISFWEPAFVNVASLPKVSTSSALDEIERAPFPVLSPSHRRMKIYLCWSSVVVISMLTMCGPSSWWKSFMGNSFLSCLWGSAISSFYWGVKNLSLLRVAWSECLVPECPASFILNLWSWMSCKEIKTKLSKWEKALAEI